MILSIVQKITEEEYDGDLDTYENEVKLYKKLEDTHILFLKILKIDIQELEPIDDYKEYLTDQITEYDRKTEQNNYSDYDEETLVVKALMTIGRSYISKGLWKNF